MSEKIIEELKNRRETIEMLDLDLQNKNKDHFRGLWMNIMILSSAIIIGVLPLINENSNIIKSLLLAKLGLLLIILIIIFGIIYYANVLNRERSMLFDLSQFHEKIFFKQENLINLAVEQKKSIGEVLDIFGRTKIDSFNEEQKIREKHLVGGKFFKLRLFVDKYFSVFLCYGFVLGLILIIFSFIINAPF